MSNTTESRTERVDLFQTRLGEIGVDFDMVKGKKRAVAKVIELAGESQVCYWQHPVFKKIDLERVAAEDADLSLVVAEFAVAESGTVGLVHGPDRPTAEGLLPPRQIVLVDAKNIKDTLHEALKEIYSEKSPTEVPTNIALVTGPSKTADIGLKTIIGVHSPKELHVVISA